MQRTGFEGVGLHEAIQARLFFGHGPRVAAK